LYTLCFVAGSEQSQVHMGGYDVLIKYAALDHCWFWSSVCMVSCPCWGCFPLTLARHAEHTTSGDVTATMWVAVGRRLRDILARTPDLQRGPLRRHPISSRLALGYPNKPRLGSSSHRSRHQHGSKRRHSRPVHISLHLPEAVACLVLSWTCSRSCVAEARRSSQMMRTDLFNSDSSLGFCMSQSSSSFRH